MGMSMDMGLDSLFAHLDQWTKFSNRTKIEFKNDPDGIKKFITNFLNTNQIESFNQNLLKC